MLLTELTIDSYPLIKPFYDSYSIDASEVNFTNLFMWRHKYHFSYTIIEDFLWICNVKNESTYYFSQPIGNYSNSIGLIASILKLKKDLNQISMPFIIKKSDSRFKEFLDTQNFDVDISEDRNSFDYIYDFQELKNLAGNKFHKKKNHINKFIKSVENFEYLPLCDATLPLLVQNFENWFVEHQHEDLEDDFAEEKHAISEALNHYKNLPFQGGMMTINGHLEAYTLGERLNADTVLIHIEKANMSIPGLYPMINQQFLEHYDYPVKWINREQDLGLEGLRKAKMSYHPTHFINKYIIRFN